MEQSGGRFPLSFLKLQLILKILFRKLFPLWSKLRACNVTWQRTYIIVFEKQALKSLSRVNNACLLQLSLCLWCAVRIKTSGGGQFSAHAESKCTVLLAIQISLGSFSKRLEFSSNCIYFFLIAAH